MPNVKSVPNLLLPGTIKGYLMSVLFFGVNLKVIKVDMGNYPKFGYLSSRTFTISFFSL